jgi:hypothetical protein
MNAGRLNVNVYNMSSITPGEFLETLKNADKTEYLMVMKHIMAEYGTSLHCNRFAIGNSNEYAVADVVRSTGLNVIEMQDASRVDQEVIGLGKYSIKYSGSNNIKLHNSNNISNTDTTMHNTLLVTPTEWWYLTPEEMTLVGINYKDFLKNTGDGLALKRTILTSLKSKGYKHFFHFDISVDKKKCKNKETSKVFYDSIKAQLGI